MSDPICGRLALFALLFAGMGWSASPDHELELERATYLFEFEGQFTEAQRQFQHVLNDGNSKEQARAAFYLGKVSEALGDTKGAIYYYRQVLDIPDAGLELHYWVSERLGQIDPKPSTLLQALHSTPVPVRQLLGGDPIHILYSNGSIGTITPDGKLATTQTRIPPDHTLLDVSSSGLLAVSSDRRSLLLLSPLASESSTRLALDSPLQGFLELSGSRWFFATQRTLTLREGGRFLWRVENRWSECSPGTVLRSGRVIALNCPDNTVQLLRSEDGSPSARLVLPDAVNFLASVGDGLLAVASDGAWFFRPPRSLAPIWHHPFRNIVSAVPIGEDAVALHSANGLMQVVDLTDGSTRSQAETGDGKVTSLGHFLAMVSEDGLVSVWDNKAQPSWTWNGGSAPITPVVASTTQLAVTLASGKIAVFDRKYYGIQRSELQALAEQATRAASNGRWTEARSLADSLLSLEPGNPAAWSVKAQCHARNGDRDSSLAAWGQAVIHSDNQTNGSTAMRAYGNELGAEWVSPIGIAPGNNYPVLFGDDRGIYHLDPGGRGLVSLDPATGARRWRTQPIPLAKDFITANDRSILAIGSGIQLTLVDLQNHGRILASVELPGKPFQLVFMDRKLLVSTWNGYILCLDRSTLAAQWSRRPTNSGAWLGKQWNQLFAWALDGTLWMLDPGDGSILENRSTRMGEATGLLATSEGLLLEGAEGRLVFLTSPDTVLWEKDLPADIFSSMQLANNHKLLLGLSNQTMTALDLASGEISWTWSGSGSVFMRPSYSAGILALDQGRSIALVSATSGKTIRRIALPDAAGPVLGLSNSSVIALRSGLVLSFRNLPH